jgi:hypothetical protein
MRKKETRWVSSANLELWNPSFQLFGRTFKIFSDFQYSFGSVQGQKTTLKTEDGFDHMLHPQAPRLTGFALLYQQISMCSKFDWFYVPGSC